MPVHKDRVLALFSIEILLHERRKTGHKLLQAEINTMFFFFRDPRKSPDLT